jgi:uncharacterized protein (TIGR00375 family)
MQIISDLQIHSKYSRAVSQQMILPQIYEWAKRKGINLMATGDWTHPLWMMEIKHNLEELGNGLLKLKPQGLIRDTDNGPFFLLATEVSCIYSQGGKLRRIHTLIWVDKVDTAEKINQAITQRGGKLMSDGRPILGLTSIEIAELVFSIDPKALIIPAHAWTPWFSLYGSESGFDSIEEAFGKFAPYIHAIETGLSSNPSMNWRVGELDKRSILSFSDAHSGPKIGREATVFELQELSFEAVRNAILNKSINSQQPTDNKKNNSTDPKNVNKISYTIEFYPEEGKYHYSGHRNCGVKQEPEETKKKGVICPVCGKKLTIGVMHRVEELAVRDETDLKLIKKPISGTLLDGIYSQTFPDRPGFVMLVPLLEIITETKGALPTSQSVINEYTKLVDNLGGEFSVLLNASYDDITKQSGERVSNAIEKVRTGNIYVDPGYDGVFGKVEIFHNHNEKKDTPNPKEQLSLF